MIPKSPKSALEKTVTKRIGETGIITIVVETEEHLARCLVYIDLNRVRAGVVEHPSEWPFSGYDEIQNPPLRYALIDREKLISACNLKNDEQLRREHRQWIEAALRNDSKRRQPEWTESIAVGSQTFVEAIRKKTQCKGERPKGKGICRMLPTKGATSGLQCPF